MKKEELEGCLKSWGFPYVKIKGGYRLDAAKGLYLMVRLSRKCITVQSFFEIPGESPRPLESIKPDKVHFGEYEDQTLLAEIFVHAERMEVISAFMGGYCRYVDAYKKQEDMPPALVRDDCKRLGLREFIVKTVNDYYIGDKQDQIDRIDAHLNHCMVAYQEQDPSDGLRKVRAELHHSGRIKYEQIIFVECLMKAYYSQLEGADGYPTLAGI